MDILAVGDLLSGIFTTVGSNVSFQPAAGVEIIILSLHGDSTCRAGLTNGVTISDSIASNSSTFGQGFNTKIGINNTNYLNMYTNGPTPPSYSGIQIK